MMTQTLERNNSLQDLPLGNEVDNKELCDQYRVLGYLDKIHFE